MDMKRNDYKNKQWNLETWNIRSISAKVAGMVNELERMSIGILAVAEYQQNMERSNGQNDWNRGMNGI